MVCPQTSVCRSRALFIIGSISIARELVDGELDNLAKGLVCEVECRHVATLLGQGSTDHSARIEVANLLK